MPGTKSPFDQNEYLHLAMEAIRRNDHGAALEYLKTGVEHYPEDAKLTYLLGAEYAQISLFDQAETLIKRAIELDNSLYTARFQLGLMQITHGKVDEARQSWFPLEELGENHPLCLFKQGLEALAIDNFEDAREKIKAGIAVNTESTDLNRDMENLLQQISESSSANSADLASGETPHHLWMNAYQNTDSEQ